MAIGTAIRMAGPNLFKFLKGGMSNQDLAARLMGDIFGGGMAAFYTPGDLGDKAIAGITDAAFSGALGLGAGRLVGPNSGILGFGADMAGSMAGMEVGRAVGDQAMRAKDSLMGVIHIELILVLLLVPALPLGFQYSSAQTVFLLFLPLNYL